MNKKYITIIVCAAMSMAAGNLYSEYAGQPKIPQGVLDAFAKQYPGVKAKWEQEHGNYEATFEKDKHELNVTYDPQGNLIETEEEINISEAPATISTYIEQHYHKKIKEIERVKDAKGVITYEAELGKVELIFDANGQFVKEKKK